MYIEIIGDNSIFEGVNMKELVRQMKDNDFTSPDTIREYMTIVKERIKLLHNKNIDTADVKSFLLSLEKNKIIRIHGRTD